MGASATPFSDARGLIRLALAATALTGVAVVTSRTLESLYAVHAVVAMTPGTGAALMLVVAAVMARNLRVPRTGLVLGALASAAVSALLAEQVESRPQAALTLLLSGDATGFTISVGTILALTLTAGLALVHLAPGVRPEFRRGVSQALSWVILTVIAVACLAPHDPAANTWIPSPSPIFAALGLVAFVVTDRWARPARGGGLPAWAPWLTGLALAALSVGVWIGLASDAARMQSELAAEEHRAVRDHVRASVARELHETDYAASPLEAGAMGGLDDLVSSPPPALRSARANTLVLWGGLLLAVLVGAAMRRTERLIRAAGRLSDARSVAIERLASLSVANAELEQETLALREGEEAMRRQAREKRRVLDSLSAFLIAVDGEGVVTEWNFVSSEVFGLRGSEALGRPFDMLPLPWDDEVVREAVDSCLATGSRQVLEHQPLTGEEGRIVSLTVNPTQDGARRGFALVGADVTERRLLEVQLRASQKLESVGTLAAGIAHEINTPMQFVGDNVRFVGQTVTSLLELLRIVPELRDAVAATPGSDELTGRVDGLLSDIDVEFTLAELPAAVDETLEGIDRVSTIVRAMKEFSHPGGEDSSPADVNQAVQTTLAVARNEYKYVADVDLSLDELPPVDCWIGDLKQVFLNLLVNGTHAIKERLGEDSPERGRLTVSSRVDGEHVELRFGDTGTGIPEHARGQVFDQFFTTKEVGRGTGMGLAICRSVIAEKHGGTIDFESEVGEGTTFVIRLPVTSPREAAVAAQDHDPTAVCG